MTEIQNNNKDNEYISEFIEVPRSRGNIDKWFLMRQKLQELSLLCNELKVDALRMVASRDPRIGKSAEHKASIWDPSSMLRKPGTLVVRMFVYVY